MNKRNIYPVMYIFVNKELSMSPGKVGAQAAHAAVEGYRLSKKNMIDEWYKGKHYTKIVLQAKDERHLRSIEKYLKDRDFKCSLIVDEGRTEIDPHTATALGVEVVDKNDDHTYKTFSSFDLYRPEFSISVNIK